MTPLGKLLRERFKTPQEVLIKLGLDSALIELDDWSPEARAAAGEARKKGAGPKGPTWAQVQQSRKQPVYTGVSNADPGVRREAIAQARYKAMGRDDVYDAIDKILYDSALGDSKRRY